MTIDAHVHKKVPGATAVLPYLADSWIKHTTNTLCWRAHRHVQPAASPVVARPGSKPGSGPAGSGLELLTEQVLDPPAVRAKLTS